MDTSPLAPEPLRVLILTQDRELRANLGRILEPEHPFEFCDSPAEAEARQAQKPFALVVVQLRRGEELELEFLRELRKRWPQTMRVVLVEESELDRAVAQTDSEIHRFLGPPFSEPRMRLAIEGALQAHRTHILEEAESNALLFNYESLAEFNGVLEARILQQTAMLRRLHQFALDLNRAQGLRDLVGLAVEVTHELLDGRGVHVQVWDPDSVQVEAARGPEMSAHLHSEPLCTFDGQVGEIVVDELGPDDMEFGPRERELVNSIASSTAVAVHNELRRRERDQAQHATILAMARLSEQRDNETGQHLERVSGYCKLIAEGLRTDGQFQRIICDEWIEDLVRSAPLHDIGKVGIPDSILLKPGKLTPEEWVIMKTHTEIGGATLDAVIQQNSAQEFLRMGRDIALGHHERWDGSGYPRGLVGEAIPLVARIVALADVYDALTTVRPYKAAWTHREALAWIAEGRGRHFDPRIVDAFMAREAQADEIRSRLLDHMPLFVREEFARSA